MLAYSSAFMRNQPEVVCGAGNCPYCLHPTSRLSTASSSPAHGPALSSRGIMSLVIVLLAAHYLLAVGGKLSQSTTSDELVHLTAGVSYWQNHDYRLHPENGILPQRWA